MRTDWGFVHQDPREGLRMGVSAGANVGERLMAVGERHYGGIRGTGARLARARGNRRGPHRRQSRGRYSGGMRQRLQIARNLVTHRASSSWTSQPAGSMFRCRRAFSTSCAGWCAGSASAVVIVTHDLAVARLLSTRIVVMQQGKVIETGLTDQVLEDPQAALHAILVSSVLQV